MNITDTEIQGVKIIDPQGRAVSLEEKPSRPKSNYDDVLLRRLADGYGKST